MPPSNLIDYSRKASTEPSESFEISFDPNEDEIVERDIDDVLNEMQDHLTKEELLLVSLYKNSKRQRNTIYKVFLKKYYKKELSTSAITKRKHRILKVLESVGTLLRFKRANSIDVKLKGILTKKQLLAVLMYERRWTLDTIKNKLKLGSERAIMNRYYRAVTRLKRSDDPQIAKYLVLLGNVLRFSRKFPISRRS